MHIAIIGCGQLSRMLALSGIPLGFTFCFVADDPGADTRCVEHLGVVARWNPQDSSESLYKRLGSPEVVTIEKEQIDPTLLDLLSPHCSILPNRKAFLTLQDRLREKELLYSLSIPSAPHLCARPAVEAMAEIPLPLVAKSRRGGYDGKNQYVLKTPEDASEFDARNAQKHYIIEQWIPFDREVSIISARDLEGKIVHYPITENAHENGILKHSIAPAQNISEKVTQAAQRYIASVMNHLQYVGVMAMECFVVKDQLLVNEIAPRVHNSGHWTQTGCITSQFENHLRAITGLPLGSSEHHSVSGMVNLIGTEMPSAVGFSAHSTMHWYNKKVRPGRKLGHVNFSGASHDELLQKMERFRRDALAMRASGYK